MKRFKLIAMGIVVVAVIVISPLAGRNKVYEKTMKHENPVEAIEDCIGYSGIHVKSDNNTTSTPKEFFESISRRQRLLVKNDSLINFNNLPAFTEYKIEEVKGKELEAVKKEHEQSYLYIPNYKKPEKVLVYKMKGTYSPWHYSDDINLVKEDGTVIITEEDAKLDNGGYYFVVVDEGEGYVVDYHRNLRDEPGDYSLYSEVN